VVPDVVRNSIQWRKHKDVCMMHERITYWRAAKNKSIEHETVLKRFFVFFSEK
jgi:hypothetical protein